MDLEKNKYSGMSLNEMLFGAGLMAEFDKAVKEKNEVGIILILKKVNIPELNARKIIKTILDNPEKYGFKE